MVDADVKERLSKIALKYAEYLKENLHLHSLYIYGSYAKNQYTDDSDIDIAVVANGFTGDLVEDTFMLMKIRRKVDNRIEPHPFPVNEFNENDPLAREVIQTGIKII